MLMIQILLIYCWHGSFRLYVIDDLEAERLVAIALEKAQSAKEKAVVLEISVIFYGQQLNEQKAVSLGLQALQVGPCL